MSKSADAFRTISEVAEWLDTPAHVLRFWESKFTQVKPVKRAGGRRYYRPADMRLLGGIKKLLHDDGMTIKGVQKILREQGIKHVSSLCELSLGDDDEADLDVMDTVEAEEPADTVVPFAKPAQADEAEADLVDQDEQPETAIAEDTPSAVEDEPEVAAVEAEVAPDPEDGAIDAPETTVADSGAASDDAPALEELSAEMAEPEIAASPAETSESATEAEPDATPPPEPALPSFLQRSMADRVAAEDETTEVPAPEPAPPPAQIEPVPSALTYLSRIHQLSAEQAQQIAPILEKLKAVGR